MRQKRKLGRKLLSFLLTLAMVVGLVPGIGMTAYAADIPYASLKNTTNVITFDNKQWYLIDYDESTVTLLKKECVDASKYDSNGSSNTYSGSTVESAVDKYYTDEISNDVKTAIVDGKMFLLTTEQANAMTDETRKCSQASGAYNAWWLCSPTFDGYASCVDGGNGSVDDSFGYYVGDTLGVRPALKLDLSKVTFDSDTNNTFTVGSAQTPTETLLTTITPTSQTTYDQSVDGVVEVNIDTVYNYYNGKWSWGENDEGSVMVEGKEGYTITKCEFIDNSLTFTDTEAPFKINKRSGTEYIDEGTGMGGVTSIKVYGYATSPTETLLTGISLDKTTAQAIDVEGTVSFTATVTPDNATDKTVKWSVGGTNPYAVKLYSDANCTAGNEIGTDATSTLTVYAKGIRAGSATVTCTSIADSTKSASCDVMVVREKIGAGDLREGDILGYFITNITGNNSITLQAGGYIDENGNVGQTDLDMGEDYIYYVEDDDNHNKFYYEDHYYRPYVNGSVARYWIVVSSSGSASSLAEVTLKGYDPGQSNNPFTEDVIYRRYSADGKPLADGTLSANVGIKVERDTITWYNGKTYVVSDDVTITDRIKVIGTVNLILLDGAKLTANEGISVNGSEYSGAERKTLNIYAGSTIDTILGTGQLIADARNCDWDWDCAGLGGDDGKSGGVLNIYGGVITAYGREHGAGIGGGEGNYHNDITIYGGTISAYGGDAEYDNEAGAGIGSGWHGLNYGGMGNVKIYGGSVTAVGGKGAAGIGGGAEAYVGGDNVYVYGGTVVATGAAGKEGIGKGSGEGDSGNLTLGCVKLETSTDNVNWTETTDTGSRTQYMKITPVPHDLKDYPAVAATCTTSGNSAYWKCDRCGKYFSDAEGANEIAENSWVIPETGHNLSYSANNNTITATCSNSGCELAGKSLSVIAPEDPIIFDGSGKEANISPGYDATVFPYVSDITYTKDNVALTGVPVDVGTYVASVSAGASASNCDTASVTYTIVPASMTVNASDVNVEYDGNPHGISVNVSKPESGSTVTFGIEEGTYDQSQSPTITDVSDSPFTVYYKVTADNYEDYTGSAKVTITNASQTAPAAPTMDSATATSITLTDVAGCEYSKDGSTWQTSNIFTGLTPDTTYTFYQRKAAVTNHNASLASPGADFSTSAHVHSFSYTADGDTITATCNDQDGCPLADSEYKATLTISANGGTYDGETSYGATITDEKSIKGDAVVNYYKADENGERGDALSPLTTAPTNAGRYWAEITLGTGEDAKTAHVVYTIEKAAETAPAADTNQLNINYPDEIISAKQGYEVASDNEGTGITNFSSILDEATPTVYIRKTASDDNHTPSDWVTVTLSSRPDAPTELGSTNATDGTTEDGTITDVNDTMEYSADGTNWTPVNGITITDLKAGTYKVRVKATEGAPCGNAADVTVGSNYKAMDDSVSVIIKKGDSEIGETVPVVDDVLTADCEASNIIYQWYKDGEPINGATGGTYTLTKYDVGKAITVQAIQTKKADGENYGENDRPKKMSESTKAVVKKDGPAAPASAQVAEFVPDYSAETFSIGEGYEVSSTDDEDGIITDKSLTDVIDGTRKIYIRVKETEDTKAGSWLEVTLPERPAAPTELGSTNATDGASKDGTITGVNDTMEYSADGTNWTPVNGITITGLKAGTYKVRVKATEDKPAGEIAEVTVGSRKLTLTDRQKPTQKTNLKYNGSDQALLDAPADGLPDGAVEIIYAIGKNTDTAPEPDADGTPDDQKRWLTSIPKATEAGTYYVWYKVVGDENHNDVEPECLVVTINEKQQTSNGTITTDGIYCASNYPSIQAGISIHKSNEADTVEYRWVACDSSKPGEWFEVSPWTRDNNWIDWTPEKSGEYVIVCYARVVGNEEKSEIQSSFGTVYHKRIKGICQMPYSGEGGGHLIGIESYDNPNNSYQYEMLILDCNLLIRNKDPWVYTTGRCKTPSNCLWTVWQPQYGYFWTLFRLYDADGNLIDELCYGFANVN